jgi:hypothetical protein
MTTAPVFRQGPSVRSEAPAELPTRAHATETPVRAPEAIGKVPGGEAGSGHGEMNIYSARELRKRFGNLQSSPVGACVHKSGDAAYWLAKRDLLVTHASCMRFL